MIKFIIYFLPLLITLLLSLYQRKNLEEPIDNIFIIAWCLLACIPILNWFTLIIGVTVFILRFEDNYDLKSTKLNKFLFASKF